ncbi:hypothetical protein SAMN05216188_11170 [Lentzea xinjiangensis]|uniref:Uncharacterized protein n=1 Tax=Lentzea xinjiangensis TaxID=402600 RepID=A0A1H9NZ65_9PSEU|nr:hypothetical protein [Lentzea xinjiangensis]SER41161.1 hypothetical protein SAMN05216188_11170 [Lentzea xinjiangensis]
MAVEVHAPRWLAAVPGAELVAGLDEVGARAAEGHRVTALIDLVPATVPRLRALATEAVGEGARKVRVRPRGVDRVGLVHAAVELQRVADDDAVEVQFDVTSAALLRANPGAFVRADPLVVKADGTVVPICAGLERYALGRLGSMDDLVRAWDPGPVRELCEAALTSALADTGPLVPWYEHLIRTAAGTRTGC